MSCRTAVTVSGRARIPPSKKSAISKNIALRAVVALDFEGNRHDAIARPRNVIVAKRLEGGWKAAPKRKDAADKATRLFLHGVDSI